MYGSHEISFTLGTVFGLAFVIFGVAMMSRVYFFRAMIQKAQADDPALMICAVLGMMLGVFLVEIHSIWDGTPRVVVTILCWLFALQSILWIFMSEKLLISIKRWFMTNIYHYVSVVLVLLGLLMLYSAFYHALRSGGHAWMAAAG